MKSLIVIAALLVTGQLFGQGAMGEVMGTILEKENVTAYNAVAYIDDNGTMYRGRADADGRFRISGIPAGKYLMKIVHKRDTMVQSLAVNVPMDGFYNIGEVVFIPSMQIIDVITVVYETDKLQLIDGNLPVLSISSEALLQSPLKNNLSDLITSMSSEVRMSPDGELMFRGARKGDMLYLMDGVKTGSIGAVPSSSIGRVMVYTGGLPAKYGDTMGGVVVMESKSYFDLYRAWYSDQLKNGAMD